MAVDTFVVYAGVYPDLESAEADYAAVEELFSTENMVDAYDAAIVQRRQDGKVKLGKKHETPTRVGGVLGGGVGLATGLVVVLFPFAAIGGGLLAATTAGGAVLGADRRPRCRRHEQRRPEGAGRASRRRSSRIGRRRHRGHGMLGSRRRWSEPRR